MSISNNSGQPDDKPNDVPTPQPPKPEIREDDTKPPAGDPPPQQPPKSARDE